MFVFKKGIALHNTHLREYPDNKNEIFGFITLASSM